jgi:hypothetical protein
MAVFGLLHISGSKSEFKPVICPQLRWPFAVLQASYDGSIPFTRSTNKINSLAVANATQ